MPKMKRRSKKEENIVIDESLKKIKPASDEELEDLSTNVDSDASEHNDDEAIREKEVG